MAKPHVILLHWNEAEMAELARRIKGFKLTKYVPVQGEGMKGLKELGVPDALVISLDRLPSHGRDVGWAFRRLKATRLVPLVYVGGASQPPATISKIRQLHADAVFCDWNHVNEAIAEGLRNPPTTAPPSRSAEIFHTATPLAQKLGIKPGMPLALIGAPGPLEKMVPGLPVDVTIHEWPSRDTATGMTLWFVRSTTEFEEELPQIARELGPKPRLWIFYEKGGKRGLAWTRMLESAGRNGLAQFKVLRLDEVWSGVGFGRARGV